MYGVYYQAEGVRNKIWFIIGCFRNEGDWAFARTYDKNRNILEFFVAPGYEQDVVSLLQYLKDTGYLVTFEKKPNRIQMSQTL